MKWGCKRSLPPNLGWPLEPSTSASLYFRKAPLVKNHFIELVSCLVGKFIWQTHATGVEALRNTSNKWISATFILIFPLILIRKLKKKYIQLIWKNFTYSPVCAVCLVTQLFLTLCNLMDCSPPGSSVHGIFQARILEWVAIPFSRGSSRCTDRTWVL